MTHGSLFSGIGGFDLAAQWMGWQNLFHCEWNEFGQRVLKHYWPKAKSYDDITKTDFTIHRGQIDVLTGGFPCQPYSSAGKRLGKEDDRHLWPEMLRAIREIQPRYVVGENVRGLTNWNGGMVFDEVQADLESEGYEVLPFLLPACGVNAPHRRDRIWFVSYSGSCAEMRTARKHEGTSEAQRVQERHTIQQPNQSNNVRGIATNADSIGFINRRKQLEPIQQGHNKWGNFKKDVPNTTSEGLERILQRESLLSPERIKEGTSPNPNSGRQPGQKHGQAQSRLNPEKDSRIGWANFPTQPPVCSRNDGVSSRLDGITFPKWRNESIKAAGNAIVPQVAFEIFKAIHLYDEK